MTTLTPISNTQSIPVTDRLSTPVVPQISTSGIVIPKVSTATVTSKSTSQQKNLTIPIKYKCKVCNCARHPDCIYTGPGMGSGDACHGCIDYGSGCHLKIDSTGTQIDDVLEDQEQCPNCGEYYYPEDEECQCQCK
jgi:hypothetical protein